ncbi:hypothetical protein C4571_02975 [Candidatus Parcubacteria bacterium]|nr:MAG: hypothetical protein C4571_02975 [Candidatus Parcubacteria bacterium]
MAHFFGLVVLIAIIGVVAYSYGGHLFTRIGPRFGDALSGIQPYSVSVGLRERTRVESRPDTVLGVSSTPPVAVDPRDIPEGFSAQDISPHFGKVQLGSVSAGPSGRISLYANFKDDESVNITRWRIQGNDGSHYIPQAVNVYDPSGLSSESDIFLKNGEFVNLYFTSSAIGKNIRLNKCIGYLQGANQFSPSLPLSCPYIDRGDIRHLTGTCQNYLLSLGGCRLPAANPPVPFNDYACRAYLDTINYRGCFDRYSKDSDFLSREWWVWIGSTQFLDPSHDRVLLLDRLGLLVDEYSY